LTRYLRRNRGAGGQNEKIIRKKKDIKSNLTAHLELSADEKPRLQVAPERILTITLTSIVSGKNANDFRKHGNDARTASCGVDA
jgi:hypothetical protein